MITDRVIALIETHANMAGVEKAKAGFGGLNLSTLALGAALGGLVLVGKAAIQNTEAMDKANLSLRQATDVGKVGFDALKSSFDAWAEANKRYIPDQYAAETALAAFVRTGVGAKTAMRELNDALDLSTLRSIPLEDAQKQLTLALTGSSKALKVLGITSAEYSAIMKDEKLMTDKQAHSLHLSKAALHAYNDKVEKHNAVATKQLALLALIETKTKDGRKAQTELTQSTQALNKDWQDITTKVGPPLLGLFTGIIGKVDSLVTWLDRLGQDKSWNKNVSAFLGTIQNSIIEDVKWVQSAISAIQSLGKFLGYMPGDSVPSPKPNPHGRASGGSVGAGQAYTVGERGPETLVMGSSSGSIIARPPWH